MSDIDRDASIFAQCLLMPEEHMRAQHAQALEKGLQGERMVKHMADKFRVPIESMWVRLVDLGLEIRM